MLLLVLKYSRILYLYWLIDFLLVLLQNLVSQRLVNIRRLHEERVETLKKLAYLKVCFINQIKSFTSMKHQAFVCCFIVPSLDL